MSEIFRVATLSDLYDALLSSEGGETILVEAGDYGSLDIYAQVNLMGPFTSTVTIASADPNDPAIFDGMALNGVNNLRIEAVVFDYTYDPEDPYYVRPFQIKNSQDVTIANSLFDGDKAPLEKGGAEKEYGFGYGLSIRDASGIVLEGNEFQYWSRGVVVDTVNDITLRGNDLHNLRGDGLNFVAVQGVLIEENHIHNFDAAYESGDHRDMIQFWTSGVVTPSTDIIIRDNILDLGEGSYTQSIFMRNEAVDSQNGGEAMYYQNVLIEGNTIYNGHLHGITVGETKGLTIRKNSLVAVADDKNPDQDDSAVWVPSINVKPASKEVIIESNITSTVTGEQNQADWLVKGNAFIQNKDPFSPGYYGDVFVSSSMDLGENGHAFVAVPGGMLDFLSAGTFQILSSPTLTSGDVLFNVEASPDGQNARIFDASLTAQMLSEAGITDATYVWSFSDGTTNTGVSVTHKFSDAGAYDATLVVSGSDGKIYTADSIINIRGAKVVSFDAAQNAFIAYGYGEEETLNLVDTVESDGLLLGATGTVASVSRSALQGLRGNDELTLDFTLQGEGDGEVFRFHQTFVSSVNSSGELSIQLYNSDFDISSVTTKGVAVNDGQAHDISVQLKNGVLLIFVDGVLIDQNDFVGILPTSGSWDLVFGNPWGSPNFDGTLSAFDITVNESDYADLQVTTPIEPTPEPTGPSYETDIIVEQPLPDTTETEAVTETQLQSPDGSTDSGLDASTDTVITTTVSAPQEPPAGSIVGTAESNVLIGTVKGDIIYGLEGSDLIYGMSNDDLLNGGADNDRLYGGDGSDVFVFAAGGGKDRVLDFEDGIDFIQLEGIDFEDVTISKLGKSTLLTAGDDTMNIRNVGVSDITIDDFIF